MTELLSPRNLQDLTLTNPRYCTGLLAVEKTLVNYLAIQIYCKASTIPIYWFSRLAIGNVKSRHAAPEVVIFAIFDANIASSTAHVFLERKRRKWQMRKGVMASREET